MPRKDRSLMQGAYEEIKRRVITLELGPGTRLDDRGLSAQLNLSRTPVREAIFRLGAEGFVELRADGFVVRPLDLVDIAHFFEAHVVLSRAVARLAARRATPPQLERLGLPPTRLRGRSSDATTSASPPRTRSCTGPRRPLPTAGISARWRRRCTTTASGSRTSATAGGADTAARMSTSTSA
jgi:hypothetical protein